MRLSLAVPVTLALASSYAHAQTLKPSFIYGRDYTFERMEATRVVHDSLDDGTIRLVSYVYRPVKNDRHEVVLFSHGSTGGEIRSPKEPGDAPAPALWHFLVLRGYTVVAPMRRGRGESSGHYVEECAFYLGQCTLAQQNGMTERSLHEAMLDTRAVIDQVIVGRLAPPGSKILLAGHSRGGFLSLMMASDRPQQVSGVINFAGGWLGVGDGYTAEERRPRLDSQTVRLARAARAASTIPTIWIYAARDPFYTEDARQALLRAWRDAGGQAEYVFVPAHDLPSGHALPTDSTLWGVQLDAFLRNRAAVPR